MEPSTYTHTPFGAVPTGWSFSNDLGAGHVGLFNGKPDAGFVPREQPAYGRFHAPVVEQPRMPGDTIQFSPELGGPGGSRLPQFARSLVGGMLFGLKDGPSDRFVQGLQKGPYQVPGGMNQAQLMQALNGIQNSRINAGLQGIGPYIQ